MKTNFLTPPRKFQVGQDGQITIQDNGKVYLEENEMISFVNSNHKELDFSAKSWGYYATPSINGRLKDEGFKTALVKNSQERYFIMVVDNEKIDEFLLYIKEESQEIIQWIDEL